MIIRPSAPRPLGPAGRRRRRRAAVLGRRGLSPRRRRRRRQCQSPRPRPQRPGPRPHRARDQRVRPVPEVRARDRHRQRLRDQRVPGGRCADRDLRPPAARADRHRLHQAVQVRQQDAVRLHPQPVGADHRRGRGSDQGAHQRAAGVPHRGAVRPRPGSRDGRDGQIPEHHAVALVHQQIQPPYDPVQHRPGRRHRSAGHAQRMREIHRRADRHHRQGAVAEPPVPVQQRHRTQQRPVVTDHHGAPRAPAGQRPREFLGSLRKADFRLRATAQHIFRDPHGLAVTSAGDRVDDHQQLVVSRHLGPSSGSIFVQEPLALLRQGLRLFRGNRSADSGTAHAP